MTDKEDKEDNFLKLDRPTPPIREKGDGAAVAPKPAEEVTSLPETSSYQPRKLTVNVKLDIAQIGLFVLALVTRFWRLGYPRTIVFDEILFGRFSLFYLKNLFYFDLNPPLGVQMYAWLGQFFGLADSKDFAFDEIGKEYPAEFPIWQLRSIPAICGSLLVPLAYQVIIELGLSQRAAVLAGLTILLDNALITQSRFMLLEPMILLACATALISLLKFRKSSPFTPDWWFWLLLMGVSAACAFCIKYVGGFTFLLMLSLAVHDYWNLLSDRTTSAIGLVHHLLARVFCLIVIPVAIYVCVLYVHLYTLTVAGPGTVQMTSAFQTSLEGGLAMITKNQPYEIAYGSQITLRRSFGNEPCWLHSHDHVYPIRYEDNRGSSHQYHVTCYIFKDNNNWWIVKHPDRDNLTVEVPPKPVKNGDIIELVHGISGRKLNSHDVTAPLSKNKQEVSCYVNYNVSMPPQTLWRVEISNPIDGDSWKTVRNNVRLIHVGTSATLLTTDLSLPEWGFHQKEVVTDKASGNSDSSLWNVEEHKYGQNEEIAAALKAINFIPLKPSEMSIWSKIWEVQLKLISSNMDAALEHKYKTSPLEWPLLDKNLAYWMDKSSNAQIHLLGNPVVWYTGTLSVVVCCGLIILELLRRRRQCYDLTEASWSCLLNVSAILLAGYLLHYLPYFMMDRTLFIHSYLPAFFYQVLLFAATVDIVISLIRGDYSQSSGETTLMMSSPSTQPSWRGIPSHFVRLLLVGFIASSDFMCTVGLLLQPRVFAHQPYHPHVRLLCWTLVTVWLVVVSYTTSKLSVFTYGTTVLTRPEIDAMSWKESWDFLAHA